MMQPWFADARFGLFVTWGLYAIPARGEWDLFCHDPFDIYLQEYRAHAARFNPVDFDPAAWADLAWNAGMRYVVFTTKHHDGFCLFDNPHTDFKITNTPYGKDITAMLVAAFRARGLRIGLYHSLIDWTHPHYVPDRNHPLGKNGESGFSGRDMRVYANYLYQSVEHLMTQYGQIDLLFWDYCSAWKKPEDFNPDPLLAMIRRHQPQIIINDRMSYDRMSHYGDYRTPEVAVPNVPPRLHGMQTPWETCATINGYWGYVDTPTCKPLSAVTTALIGCVAKGGNLLLNVGPDEKGAIPPISVDILREMAEWHTIHGAAVQGCGAAGFRAPDGYFYTQRGRELYLYLPFVPLGDVLLPELHGLIERAVLLRTGEAVPERPDWGLEHSPAGETRISIPATCRPGDIVRILLRPSGDR